MISLEQIQALNSKVQNALDVIVSLRKENGTLKAKLGDYEKRIEELEVLVNSFSREQDDIENGILNILQQLDKLEEDYTPEEDESVVSEPEAADANIDSSDNSTEEDTLSVPSHEPEETPAPAAEAAVEPEISPETDGKVEETVPTEPENSVEETAPQNEEVRQTFEKAEPEAELDIF